MRVLLITDGIYPYVLGGMQRHSYLLCKYLLKNGVSVHLIHFKERSLETPLNELFTVNELERFSCTELKFPKGFSFPAHYLFKSWKYSKLAYYSVAGEIGSFDFVIAKGFTGWKLISEKMKDKRYPPIAVNFHGYEMFQKVFNFKEWLKQLILRGPVRKLSRQADYVFSYGGKITEIIAGLGVSKSKILEFPSGIENEQIGSPDFSDSNPKFQFVFVGRNERRKGVEELISAISKLKSLNDVVFHFVGPFSSEQFHFDVTNNIKFHGIVDSKARLRSILENCDVLVCPSWSEGMPNVILEGMANGCAILATDVGAVSSLVSNENGWLIPLEQLNRLDQVISNIINLGKEEILIKRRHSLEKVKRDFLWTDISSRIIDRIELILSQSKN